MNDLIDNTPYKMPQQSGDEPTGESPWRVRFNSIYRKLRDQITLLEYPPGKQLDLDQLAKGFGVSRTPIRTVLQRLEQEGLVTTRHGVGTIVNDIDFEGLRDVADLRMHLAKLIGTLSPNKPRPNMENELNDLITRLKRLQNETDLVEFAKIDLALHKNISQLIGNTMLRRTYSEMYYRNARMWFFLLPQLDWQMEISAFTESMTLVRNAIVQGDVAAVGYITRNANSNVVYRINNLLNLNYEIAQTPNK